jgi:hypothetical protein
LADESNSGALKISSREELQDWLESLPPEQGRWVAVAIAARAALRVIPLVSTDRSRGNGEEHKRLFQNLTFAMFFATALARVMAKYPVCAMIFTSGPQPPPKLLALLLTPTLTPPLPTPRTPPLARHSRLRPCPSLMPPLQTPRRPPTPLTPPASTSLAILTSTVLSSTLTPYGLPSLTMPIS